MRVLIALSLASISTATAIAAAPLAATPVVDRPAGIQIRHVVDRLILTDAQGHALYLLNMRLAMARTGQSSKFCIGPCATDWASFSPVPADKPVGDWTIANGAEGKQWAYKNALVFRFRADTKPGDAHGDGYQDIFKALTFIPPPPIISAPPNVQPIYVGSRFILADQDKNPLVTEATTGRCTTACKHEALSAGMASRPIGDWTILSSGDRPQWAYRGRPVYIAKMADAHLVPRAAITLPSNF